MNINDLKKAFKAGRKIGREDAEIKIKTNICKDLKNIIDKADSVFWGAVEILGTAEGDNLSRKVDDMLNDLLIMAREYGATKPERETEIDRLVREADEAIGLKYSLTYDEFIRFPAMREKRNKKHYTMPEIEHSRRALNDFIDIPF